MSANSITISFSVENVALADVMLTPTRAYYRFATTDTREDGEIPCSNPPDIFDKIIHALNNFDAEPMPQEVKCSAIISYDDNSQIIYNNNNISQSAYSSLINILPQISDEFMFIRGFR